MKQFHHIGIPSQTVREGETYLEDAKLYVTAIEASEHQIEWLRFEADSPMPEALRTIAHVAFQVEDLDAALEGKDVLLEPFSPMEGVRMAFILDGAAPVEYLQIDGKGEQHT